MADSSRLQIFSFSKITPKLLIYTTITILIFNASDGIVTIGSKCACRTLRAWQICTPST